MREDIRPVKTKKSIKQALLELISEKDVSDITISELVEKANVSRKTFYLHYKSITEILEEVEQDLIDLLAESVMKDKTVGFRVRLINFIKKITNLIQEDVYYYSLIARSSYSKNLFKNIDRIINNELLDALDNEAQLDPIKKQCLISFIIGGITNTIISWVNIDEDLKIEDLSNLMFEFINNNMSCYLENFNCQYK